MTKPKIKKVYLDGVLVGEVPAGSSYDEEIRSTRALIDQKGLRREVTLYDAMLRQAVGFGRAAARIHESDLLAVPRYLPSAPAFFVNSAFAIELYLKALGEKYGKPLGRGHKLQRLYELLPAPAVIAIEREVPTAAAGRQVTDFSLTVTLADLNDAFVTWRYSYEHDRLEAPAIEHIIVVVQALHMACHESGA